jgi:hypothetical protein
MNTDDFEPPFRTTQSSRRLDHDKTEAFSYPEPDLSLETVAHYREIYRQKLVQEEPQLWARRLLEWARKARQNVT